MLLLLHRGECIKCICIRLDRQLTDATSAQRLLPLHDDQSSHISRRPPGIAASNSGHPRELAMATAQQGRVTWLQGAGEQPAHKSKHITTARQSCLFLGGGTSTRHAITRQHTHTEVLVGVLQHTSTPAVIRDEHTHKLYASDTCTLRLRCDARNTHRDRTQPFTTHSSDAAVTPRPPTATAPSDNTMHLTLVSNCCTHNQTYPPTESSMTPTANTRTHAWPTHTIPASKGPQMCTRGGSALCFAHCCTHTAVLPGARCSCHTITHSLHGMAAWL